MPIAYIGIGSNLGDREENCLRAIDRLSREGITVKKRSSLYETEPWGLKDQPKFINAAVEIETEREPEELLETLKKIENDFGKQAPSAKWGPRVIDLDILFYDDRIIHNTDLEVPHPHLHERDFVLKPLSEIAPQKIHPLLKKTLAELLTELDNE
ncbi:MAG TPA: 2-amino-4-hydroxy-6-hydroxymethyldihydropteridine diphosphokinase [Thermodesulfovibrionales bacterium]|nr:2-amino-4-hydroxy-6-hydroxymethyldihydropteridine diphosphokinase [Thermodesulfovibrionales bacterium]